MGIKNEIMVCTKCPLYKNMDYGPMTPMWEGIPKFFFICDVKITKQMDQTREFLTELEYKILTDRLRSAGINDWYFTPFIKCVHNNKISEKRICSGYWISKEVLAINDAFRKFKNDFTLTSIKIVGGLGKQVKKNFMLKFEFDAPSVLCSSPKKLDQFELEMKKLNDQLQ